MTADWEQNLALFRKKMTAQDLAPVVIDTFAFYYRQVATGETGLISNRDIQPVQPGEIASYADMAQWIPQGRDLSRAAIMIRLNGGLGTSMGLTGPKSLLPVKNGRSFLDIIIGQAHRQDIPLALMNSFSTHDATRRALASLDARQRPRLFMQNKFPKIQQADLSPAESPDHPDLEWNPPGHGDVFTALSASGMLDELIRQGIQYAFIANADNLGATMDPGLLGYFAATRSPFMMEVADKTPSDIKGGHLARRLDGRLILREAAQCPANEMDTFRDIGQYRYFNTNNIWVNLGVLQSFFKNEGSIHLPIIVNAKPIDPRHATSQPVYQIETAMGAAISLFDDSVAIRVSRDRFIPVKTCNDLLAVRSDRYQLDPDFHLYPVSGCRQLGIRISLDEHFFRRIDDFEARFGHGVPSLIECESLSVEGDVFFEADVVIKGRVKIKNTIKTPMMVPAGSVVDNEQIV